MINTFFFLLKKLIVSSILVVFSFVVVYVPQPLNHVLKAEAQPAQNVNIIGPSASAIARTAASAASIAASSGATAANTQAISISQASLVTKEFNLDMAANVIAKAMVTSLTSSIVQWINNGFEGSPAFVSDIEGFLLDVADTTAADFINRISEDASFVCSPFRLDIQAALAIQYQATRDQVGNLRECRLSDMVGNIEDFLEGEVSSGGWQDWFLVVNEPQTYTPYGQLLQAETSFRASIRNQENQELEVTSWGDGFLSGKLCEIVEGSSGSKERCVISKPGTVIANTLNKALGAGQDALISADELNEIVSALLGQIAIQTISGAAGLLGLSTSNQGQGPSFLDQLNQDTRDQVAARFGDSISIMTAAGSTQQQINQLATQYVPRLQAYVANPEISQERRNQATDAERDARRVRDISLNNLNRINGLLTDYRGLEAEITAPGTTAAQQQEIRRQQTQVLEAFYQINAFTENDLRSFRQTWDAALRP